jgi:hypothetical protein
MDDHDGANVPPDELAANGDNSVAQSAYLVTDLCVLCRSSTAACACQRTLRDSSVQFRGARNGGLLEGTEGTRGVGGIDPLEGEHL